ncbi:multidrug ABC transporter permease, partial [Kytococcus schroeteri]
MDEVAPTTEQIRADRAATWVTDVVLRDGAVAHLRPISPGDREAVAAFHRRQSERSRYLRFFATIPELSARDLDRFTQVDQDQRVALVAEIGG